MNDCSWELASNSLLKKKKKKIAVKVGAIEEPKKERERKTNLFARVEL
jgi:hypothetical protein